MAVLLLFLLIGYSVSYLFLGNVGSATLSTGVTVQIRVFDYPWQEALFGPAATAETLLTGREVWPASRAD